MPPAGHKRYEQPYGSKHIQTNTIDPLRAYEPAYIKNFPRLLTNLYKKQTPFHKNLLNHFHRIIQKERLPPPPTPEASSSQKSQSPTSPQERTRTEQPSDNYRQQQLQQRAVTMAGTVTGAQQQQPSQAPATTGFKTLGTVGSGGKFTTAGATNNNNNNNSSNTLSAVPSDFEHIFHYSEAQ